MSRLSEMTKWQFHWYCARMAATNVLIMAALPIVLLAALCQPRAAVSWLLRMQADLDDLCDEIDRRWPDEGAPEGDAKP